MAAEALVGVASAAEPEEAVVSAAEPEEAQDPVVATPKAKAAPDGAGAAPANEDAEKSEVEKEEDEKGAPNGAKHPRRGGSTQVKARHQRPIDLHCRLRWLRPMRHRLCWLRRDSPR